jgi:hypothetical protein
MKLNDDKPSQSPRDRILWILANNGGKMERSRLIERIGVKYVLLKPHSWGAGQRRQDQMTVGKQRVLISLIER